MNYILQEMNEINADGVDFVPIWLDPNALPPIICSYTKEEFKSCKVYPRSNRKYWKIINGKKKYLDKFGEIIMFDVIKAKNECVQWIRDWFTENGKDCNAVIGISGGKDSSVVAALCVEALGKDRVLGVSMPNVEQADIADVKAIADHLDIDLLTINIGRAVGDILGRLHYLGIETTNQTSINLPPRIRMATLYAVSQSVNGRVVGTDNASEAYIGYSTRWGDNVADLMPILNFTSEEVVAIGDALGLPYELTHKTPSDGLCGKTDEDNFGFTYAALNKYIRTGICEDEEVKAKIDNLHNKNLFKTQPIPSFKYYIENDFSPIFDPT